MAFIRLLSFATLAFEAAAFCAVTGVPPAATAERNVGQFWGLVVSGGIKVNVSRGSSRLVTIKGPANLMNQVSTYVSPLGALVVSLLPGACSADIEVGVPAEGPLLYLSASAGATVSADAVAGTVSSSSGSTVAVEQLNVSAPVSLTASSGSRITVAGGNAGFTAVTASSLSTVELGRLRARSVVLTASAESSISGLVAESATVVVSSVSSVSLTATGSAAYSCSSGSQLTILGSAKLTEWSSTDCRLSLGVGTTPSTAVILP